MSDFDEQLRQNAGILTYHHAGRRVVALALQHVPKQYHGMGGTIHSSYWDEHWECPGYRIDFDNGAKGKLLTWMVKLEDERS